jgi:anti-sigma28 factor (negative regulator of flagellin synthesis)
MVRKGDTLSAIAGQSRENRIEELRQLLNAGTYRVSSEDLARKLIDSDWKYLL